MYCARSGPHRKDQSGVGCRVIYSLSMLSSISEGAYMGHLHELTCSTAAAVVGAAVVAAAAAPVTTVQKPLS